MSEIHVVEEVNRNNEKEISFEERKKQIEIEENKEKEYRERQKRSPYRSWLQLNKDAWKAEDWLVSESPIAYRIFKFLMQNMDAYNALMCSQKVLQEQFDISRATVARSVKLLKDNKFIDVYKSGTANVYAVNKQIAWNSWGSNYKHGKFSANIIITESEQDNDVEIKNNKQKEVIVRDK